MGLPARGRPGLGSVGCRPDTPILESVDSIGAQQPLLVSWDARHRIGAGEARFSLLRFIDIKLSAARSPRLYSRPLLVR